ncbi:MAG: chemotaxis protein CheW [Pseudomonadota bacterium]
MSDVNGRVRSLWIPLRDINMLLPHAAVAEIGNFRVPDSQDDSPDWLLGNIHWRGMSIPVISLETLCAESAPVNLVYSRLLIINSVHTGSSVPFYAVVTAGLPRPMPFDNSVVAGAEECSHEALKCRVQVDDELAIIPDLDYLQALLEQHVDQAA